MGVCGGGVVGVCDEGVVGGVEGWWGLEEWWVFGGRVKGLYWVSICVFLVGGLVL